MDIESITLADIAAELAFSIDSDLRNAPALWTVPAKVTDIDENMPSGDAQVTIRLTDSEGITRTFTARITVKETR